MLCSHLNHGGILWRWDQQSLKGRNVLLWEMNAEMKYNEIKIHSPQTNFVLQPFDNLVPKKV